MQVSTHSRLKAAGSINFSDFCFTRVSTHSRLKAAGREWGDEKGEFVVSTHSRLKAAGTQHPRLIDANVSFNTQPPEGGWRRPFILTKI